MFKERSTNFKASLAGMAGVAFFSFMTVTAILGQTNQEEHALRKSLADSIMSDDVTSNQRIEKLYQHSSSPIYTDCLMRESVGEIFQLDRILNNSLANIESSIGRCAQEITEKTWDSELNNFTGLARVSYSMALLSLLGSLYSFGAAHLPTTRREDKKLAP